MFSTLSLCFCLNLIVLISGQDTSPATLSTATTRTGPPDLCTHSGRFSSLTQFVFHDNVRLHVGFFIASEGYYWILNTTQHPTLNNTKGRLPDGFRADGAYFRMWRQCTDNVLAPMVVIVDNDLQTPEALKYKIYFINNQTWTPGAYDAKQDPALKHIDLYAGFKSVDSIINFSNIKIGPFADKLGDENIFVFSSAVNNTYYYDWIRLKGCFHRNLTFEGSADHLFGGPLERALWKMTSPVDAAMVYTQYRHVDPSVGPLEGDVSLFEANAHYQFSVDLNLVSNGHLRYNNLLTQHYSTWMGCALGLTPEPPLLPPHLRRTTKQPINTGEIDIKDPNDTLTIKWRPTFPTKDSPVHSFTEEESNLKLIILCVLIVMIILLILGFTVYHMIRSGYGSEESDDHKPTQSPTNKSPKPQTPNKNKTVKTVAK